MKRSIIVLALLALLPCCSTAQVGFSCGHFIGATPSSGYDALHQKAGGLLVTLDYAPAVAGKILQKTPTTDELDQYYNVTTYPNERQLIYNIGAGTLWSRAQIMYDFKNTTFCQGKITFTSANIADLWNSIQREMLAHSPKGATHQCSYQTYELDCGNIKYKLGIDNGKVFLSATALICQPTP